MNKDTFLATLRKEVATFNDAVSTQNGDWIIKGFIEGISLAMAAFENRTESMETSILFSFQNNHIMILFHRNFLCFQQAHLGTKSASILFLPSPEYIV